MVGFMNTLAAVAALASVATAAVGGRNNVVLYWGQGYNQKSLRYFCGNGNADIINIGFMDLFPEQGNGYGGTNFGNQCWDPAVNDGEYAYEGPGWGGVIDKSKNRLLKQCPDLAGSIQFCQSKGVKILLSLGGATERYQMNKGGQQFAVQLFKMFGPKLASQGDYPRPFDPRDVDNPDGLMPPTVIDGFDMDIEHKSLDGDVEYVKFLNTLRLLMDNDKKNSGRDWLLSAAPQCTIQGDPMQRMINQVKFDLINVQFYNTPQCSAKNWIEKNPGAYPNKIEVNSSAFTFNAWATELKRGASADAKLTIGLLGGEPAGNAGHYLSTDDMKSVVDAYFCKEKFAGIMLWDATYANNNQIRFAPYQKHVREYLNGKALCAGDPPKTTKTLTSSTISLTSITSSSTSSWITVTTTSSSSISSDISTTSSSDISSTTSTDSSATISSSSLTSSSSSSSATISSTSTLTTVSGTPTPTATALPGGLITSPDGSCGNKYSCHGFPSLTGYSCCNKYGRCGDSASDCAVGCKASHSTPEKCAVAQPSSSTSTSATPGPTALPGGLITSPDGSCGNKYSCHGFPSLTGYSCCNKYGRCGDSADDCTGCKESHSTPGKCSVTPPPPTSTVLPGGLVTSPDGSCGNKYSCQGFPSLTGYSCCNKYGRCGSSADDCTECKESHSTPGKCNVVVAPAPSPTALPGGLVTSPDGSCGNKYSCQNFAGLAFACCNQYGRCGSSASDCGVGCKESHSTPGKCNVTPVTSPLPAGLTTSPDGSCGNKYSCQNFAGLAYACCNQYGRCGNSAADCGTGCKSTHSTPGKCSSGQLTTMATSIRPTPTANPSGLITSPDGSCGNKYTCDGFDSPFGYSCCNKYGRCGSSAADCGVGSGCKETHGTGGKCSVASGPVPTSAPPAKANLVRSPNGTCGNSYTCAGYASPLGYSCCNRYGNCGSSADDCGTGCKKGYGACF